MTRIGALGETCIRLSFSHLADMSQARHLQVSHIGLSHSVELGNLAVCPSFVRLGRKGLMNGHSFITLAMRTEMSLLRGKTVAVVGFNARPLALSAKRAGADVIVSDYWGDEDLPACCSRSVAVLTPKPGQRQRELLEEPLSVTLVGNLLDEIKDAHVDHVFVGSGFDDNTEALKTLENRFPITGNNSSVMRESRDFGTLGKLAIDHDLMFPRRYVAKSVSESLDLCEDMGYPCVVRPPRSGGGRGITLVTNPAEAEVASWRIEFDETVEEVVVQEYVRGIDASCSVLSSGDSAKALSVQGQLIGVPSAGRNCDFVYSGNYMPLTMSESVRSQIEEASEQICESLRLAGSNGLDFVVDGDGRIWLMEVNPRFQGTLEMLEYAGNMSVTTLHTLACDGELPRSSPMFESAVRLVVFARKNGTAPNLSRYQTTVDRTPKGVRVKRGDPVCSIIESGGSLHSCYGRAIDVAKSIQAGLSTP
ncbi:MAG: ATP-grasp domain-containing protein [Candidatus Hermodarchaeota archaeon]